MTTTHILVTEKGRYYFWDSKDRWDFRIPGGSISEKEDPEEYWRYWNWLLPLINEWRNQHATPANPPQRER